MGRTIVCYFSATGETRSVAIELAKELNVPLFEIEPKEKYTSQDLDWMDKKSRSTLEAKDKNARPEIKKVLDNIDSYDTIILGFPIWWYTAPRIINTFLEEIDPVDKKIILFATSGGSSLGHTAQDLAFSAPGSDIIDGMVISSLDGVKSFAEDVKNGEF